MFRHLILPVAIALLGSIGTATGAVTLTIVEFTTTKFTVSLSGTLATAANTPTSSVGGQFSYASPSAFAILLNSSATEAFYTGLPTYQSGALFQGGNPTNEGMTNSSSGRYYLSFSYDQVFPMPAGTSLSGTITFTGNFNPSAANPQDFELWSGIDLFNPNASWSVYHVNAVPEPSTLAILGFGGLFLRRSRKVGSRG